MAKQGLLFLAFLIFGFLSMQFSLQPHRKKGPRGLRYGGDDDISHPAPIADVGRNTAPIVDDGGLINEGARGRTPDDLLQLPSGHSFSQLEHAPKGRPVYPTEVRDQYDAAMRCPANPSGRCDDHTFTIFAAPKPLTRPHIALIQRNALRSWLNLKPKPRVILFGEGDGLAELAASEGVQHVPSVQMLKFKNGETMPALGPLFRLADETATTKTLVFTNADILFPQSFADALMTCNNASDAFLMMVPRNRIQLEREIDFTDPHWDIKLFHHCDLVSPNCKTDSYRALDTFSYTRATYYKVDIPPFAIGRPAYDNFLIHAAVWNHVPLVGTHQILRVWHQNHDYTHIKKDSSNSTAVNGWSPTLWTGEGSAHNRRILADRGKRAFETDGTQMQATFLIQPKVKGCKTVPYRFDGCKMVMRRYENRWSDGLNESVRHPSLFCLDPSLCDDGDGELVGFKDDRHVVPIPIAPPYRLPMWFELSPAFTPADDVSVPPISFFAAGAVGGKGKGDGKKKKKSRVSGGTAQSDSTDESEGGKGGGSEGSS